MRPLVLNDDGLFAVLPENEPMEVGSPTAPEHAVQYADIGDLNDLLTTDKNNLVAAINELFRRVAIPLVEWPEVTEFTVQYLSSLSCVLLEWSGVNLASARLEIFRGSVQGELIFEMAGVRFSTPPNRIQTSLHRLSRVRDPDGLVVLRQSEDPVPGQMENLMLNARFGALTCVLASLPTKRGCVDENGKLVGLPSSISPTSYKYTWVFRLEIGCKRDDGTIEFPSGTESGDDGTEGSRDGKTEAGQQGPEMVRALSG